MPDIPRERLPDSTLALLADPYGFIGERARAHGTDLFEARILLQPTICMTGPEAARLFYDANRFMRKEAAPLRIRRTLFGRGGVQGLDGPAHHDRKQMLMAAMAPDRVAALARTIEETLHRQAAQWGARQRVVLYNEMLEALTRAVCDWADVPLKASELPRWTARLTSLFMGAGRMGAEHWRARADRLRLEADLATIVQDVRDGKTAAPAGSALGIIATHRDRHGDLLRPRVAAVEMLNILRPTVAVAVYITHLAHALQRYPLARERLDDDDAVLRFVQEVRRFYPFFPSVAARVRHDFEWNGYDFPAGRRVLLDLYGTNRDPRIWDDPSRFDPERFRHREVGPFDLIPQGGGDTRTGHRCAGEEATIHIMRMACRFLVGALEYDVPEQDLDLDTSKTPALPKSGFVIANVQHVGERGLLTAR